MKTLARIAFILVLAAPMASQAQTYNPNHVVGYAGIFDVLDNDTSSIYGVEYRHQDIYYGFRPTLGISIDEDSGVYGYGGFYWDLNIADDFYISPNFVVGGYSHGDSKDLGGGLEFRSGIELSYALANSSRLGVAFNHISNASIYDRNPGAESLLFSYQHAFDW